MKYNLGKTFIVEKTTDQYIEIEYIYDDIKWNGALPLKIRYHGYEIKHSELKNNIESYYTLLNPKNFNQWKKNADLEWEKKTTQTYKVFQALTTNKWECRVCGPVPLVNPQPASRIRDIKKKGFIIATKRKPCSTCEKATIHDIIIPLERNIFTQKKEFRKPISKNLSNKIHTVLNRTEVVFNRKMTSKELVIDHKFPSQRWSKPETDNNDCMNEKKILKKFQLLSNQTNLLKSKECDRCVSEGKRGVFMGIKWYYKGNEIWNGKAEDDENGCIGCPWYDIEKWKEELLKTINK